MGLKGIQYVARVATYLPLIPLAILVILFLCSVGGVGSFEPAQVGVTAEAEGVLTSMGVIAVLLTYVIGFFATAGAAGADFGMNSRDSKDVSMGGLVGISGATVFAGGLALLIVAGAFGSGKATDAAVLNPTQLMGALIGAKTGGVFMWLLALAAFPPACFSSFIAANSFKTTLPKVNPFITVGIGTAVSILLAATGWAGEVVKVFIVIGASFGPVCGAMMVDYIMAGKKWAGPRAGVNMAGWISWVVGFIVGMMPLVSLPLVGKVDIPAAPLMAFIVGAVLYFALAKAGLESEVLEMAATPAGESRRGRERLRNHPVRWVFIVLTESIETAGVRDNPDPRCTFLPQLHTSLSAVHIKPYGPEPLQNTVRRLGGKRKKYTSVRVDNVVYIG
jgi:cytosine permease